MSTSSAVRLRRLRRVLTLLFTVMNAGAMVLFAYLVIREDRQQGEQGLDAELRRVTSTVARLVYYSDGRVGTDDAARDEISDRCPQFAILPGGADTFPAYLSKRICVPLDGELLTGLAAQALRDRATVSAYVRGTSGELVRVFVDPLRERSGRYLGAVVAAQDARPEESRHDRRTLLVLGATLVLVGGIAVAGHVFSGRAMRPAVDALAQQEVLLGDIAHDLRRPVTSLRALAETALAHPEERPALLPRTVRLARSMGDIIDGLLLRARFAAGVQELDRRRFRLDEQVAAAVEDIPAEGARITLTSSPSTVIGDPVLVRRAVANLVGNAVQHGHTPGRPAEVRVHVEGGRVTVADNGPGIDPGSAGPAMERFATSGSSGLGLAIVRWVVQAHGGALRVYHGEQGGAIFELELQEAP